MVNFEIPMDPITMMRNALGKEYGGSGVPLVEEKYKESVKFWENHALVKWTYKFLIYNNLYKNLII